MLSSTFITVWSDEKTYVVLKKNVHEGLPISQRLLDSQFCFLSLITGGIFTYKHKPLVVSAAKSLLICAVNQMYDADISHNDSNMILLKDSNQ